MDIESVVKIGRTQPEFLSALYAYALNSIQATSSNDANEKLLFHSSQVAKRVLTALAMNRFDLPPSACSLVEFSTERLQQLKNKFLQTVKHGGDDYSYHAISNWCGGAFSRNVYVPLTKDLVTPHQTLSPEGVNEVLVEGLLGKDWTDRFVGELKNIVDGLSRKKITFVKFTICVDLLSYSDCILLGTLFFGLSERLKENGIEIDFQMLKPYQKQFVPDDGFRVGYSPVDTLRKECQRNQDGMIFGQGVRGKVVRDSPLPVSFLMPSCNGRFRTISYLAPLLENIEFYDYTRLSGFEDRIRFTQSGLHESAIHFLFEYPHWLMIMLSGQDPTSGAGILTIADQFIWARESGLLSWDIQTNHSSALRHLSILDERGKALAIYPSLCVYFSFPLAYSSFLNVEDIGGSVDIVARLMAEYVVKVNSKFSKIIDDLDQRIADSSQEADAMRNALLTILFKANPKYSGIIPRLSPRGLLFSAAHIAKYETYEPAAARLYKNYLNGVNVQSVTAAKKMGRQL